MLCCLFKPDCVQVPVPPLSVVMMRWVRSLCLWQPMCLTVTDSHLCRHAAWVPATLVTALNHWHGPPSSFSTLSFHFFPRCFTSEGFLLPAHHSVISKCWSPWRLLPDLICQSVNHYSQQEKGAGSALKAVSPPPWPPRLTTVTLISSISSSAADSCTFLSFHCISQWATVDLFEHLWTSPMQPLHLKGTLLSDDQAEQDETTSSVTPT